MRKEEQGEKPAKLNCKYVKREGESCSLNNNCTYPNCPQEEQPTEFHSDIVDNIDKETSKEDLDKIEKRMKQEQPDLNAEEFLKSKGIYPIDAQELILDCTANKTDIRKVNLINLLTEYSQQNISLPSEEEILKGAIQQDTMQEQLAWGEGAKWMKQQIEKK